MVKLIIHLLVSYFSVNACEYYTYTLRKFRTENVPEPVTIMLQVCIHSVIFLNDD